MGAFATAPPARAASDVGAQVAALFEEHARMVLALCRALLRDRHEAEDAAQQTFLSAYRALMGGTRPNDARRWLAAIARNECRGRLRRRATLPVPLEDREVPVRELDPVDIAGTHEEVGALTRAIARLPERQRHAVVLRDFYGLSQEEVAAVLGVTSPVVEALLVRGRTRIRQLVRRTPRVAVAVVTVPASMREQLGRLIPGFELTAPELAAGGGAAAAGIAAKLASLPLGAKVAATAAAVAVGVTAPQVDDVVRGERPSASRGSAEAVPAREAPAGNGGALRARDVQAAGDVAEARSGRGHERAGPGHVRSHHGPGRRGEAETEGHRSRVSGAASSRGSGPSGSASGGGPGPSVHIGSSAASAAAGPEPTTSSQPGSPRQPIASGTPGNSGAAEPDDSPAPEPEPEPPPAPAADPPSSNSGPSTPVASSAPSAAGASSSGPSGSGSSGSGSSGSGSSGADFSGSGSTGSGSSGSGSGHSGSTDSGSSSSGSSGSGPSGSVSSGSGSNGSGSGSGSSDSGSSGSGGSDESDSGSSGSGS